VRLKSPDLVAASSFGSEISVLAFGEPGFSSLTPLFYLFSSSSYLSASSAIASHFPSPKALK